MAKELVSGWVGLIIGLFIGGLLVYSAMGNSPTERQPGADADPYVKGPVKNSIIKNFKAVKACYINYSSKNPEKTGSIKFDWSINRQGRTEDVALISSEFQNEEIEKCLMKALENIKFPKPPFGDYYIEHSFHFRPEGQDLPRPEMVPVTQ